MKAKELRVMSKEELLEKEKIFKKELFDLNYKRKTASLDKPAHFRLLRRDIARVHTILREKELTK